MTETIKCEPDLANMIRILSNPSILNESDRARIIKIEKPPEPIQPPKSKKRKITPSVAENLKTTRNKTPRKKAKPQPKLEANATTTPEKITVRPKTPQERRLESKDKKPQGVDIRKFFLPRKGEIENQPPMPIPRNLFGKIEVGEKSVTGVELNSNAQATEPAPLQVVDETESMDLSENVGIPNSSEMVVPISPNLEGQDESTVMDCENSEIGSTPPNLGNNDFVVFDTTGIIITDVKSVQGTVIPIPIPTVSPLSTVEVEPHVDARNNQESRTGDEILFQPPKEPRDIQHDMTFTAPSETLGVKNPVTQIGEVSSTGVKARSRSNSCSSTSSRLSLKGKQKGSECKDIHVALKRKNWNCVFKIFDDNLHLNMLPKSSELAQVIRNCLLKSEGSRVSSHTQCLAGNFFAKLAESASRIDVDLLLDALALVESGSPHDQQNSYWEVISKLFDEVRANAESKLVRRAALTFLSTLFLIINESYQSYLKKTVKLRLPGIARIFVGKGPEPTALENQSKTIKNFKSLLLHLFKLEDHPTEMHMSLDWVNLASSHFYNYYVSNDVRDGLTGAFVEVVFELKQQDYGLSILRRLKKNIYVQDIILNIVEKEFPVELNLQPKSVQLEFLEKMSEWKGIAVHDTYESVTKGRKNKSLNVGSSDPWEKTNLKGETLLHIACGDRRATKTPAIQELQDRVRKMKEDQIGDINVLDNALNTPLHEAAFHGRDEVICLFRDEQFYIPNADPGPFNLNLLAKNVDGSTPLHLAAQRGHKMFIQTLVSMCFAEKDKVYKLLQSRNKHEQTPLDISHSSEVHGYLERHLPVLDEVDFVYANIQLSEDSVSKLKSKTDLQKLIAYWRHLHGKIV